MRRATGARQPLLALLAPLVLLALLAVLLWPARATAAPPTAKPAQQQAWAYLGWWMPDSWRSAPLDRLDRLLFFELKVGANGAIGDRRGWPEQWGELRAAARQRALPLDLTLTVLDVSTFEKLFDSRQASARLLDEATALARHPDVAGLQVDMEVYTALRPATIASFQRFVQQLNARLKRLAPARSLSVFFPIGTSTPYYDRATLAQVDHVVLQGYDAHWPDSPRAGPLAPLAGPEAVTWDKALAAGLALGVPTQKLLLSFPLYGYEWPVADARARSASVGPAATTSFAPLPPGLVPAIKANARERARRHGVQHDLPSASASYRFRNAEGGHVEGWFEDQWSLERKGAWIKRKQAGGMAFFLLGYDDAALVRHYLRERPARPAATP
jgi:spore germination protein